MHTYMNETITFQALLHNFDKATGEKSRKPRQFAKWGRKIVARFKTAVPVHIERFLDYSHLVRFIFLRWE